jgi:hypothetical protein
MNHGFPTAAASERGYEPRIQLGPAIDPSGILNHSRCHWRPQLQCHSAGSARSAQDGSLQTWGSAIGLTLRLVADWLAVHPLGVGPGDSPIKGVDFD